MKGRGCVGCWHRSESIVIELKWVWLYVKVEAVVRLTVFVRVLAFHIRSLDIRLWNIRLLDILLRKIHLMEVWLLRLHNVLWLRCRLQLVEPPPSTGPSILCSQRRRRLLLLDENFSLIEIDIG